MKAIDVTGHKYNRLTAIRREPGKNNPWLWRCDCGNEVVKNAAHVRYGAFKSCGCLLADKNRARSTSRGHRINRKPSPTLASYWHAKGRVTNPNNPKWKTYGGRGITMCERWLISFANFLEDMGEAPDGHTIERINNDGPYSPENCRWASTEEQARNKTTTVWVEFNGQRMCLAEYGRAIGANYWSLYSHVQRYGKDPLTFVPKH